jgi:hypothetical protein
MRLWEYGKFFLLNALSLNPITNQLRYDIYTPLYHAFQLVFVKWRSINCVTKANLYKENISSPKMGHFAVHVTVSMKLSNCINTSDPLHRSAHSWPQKETADEWSMYQWMVTRKWCQIVPFNTSHDSRRPHYWILGSISRDGCEADIQGFSASTSGRIPAAGQLCEFFFGSMFTFILCPWSNYYL